MAAAEPGCVRPLFYANRRRHDHSQADRRRRRVIPGLIRPPMDDAAAQSSSRLLERERRRAERRRLLASGPPSPCIAVCRLDEATGFCEGCFRTIDEIRCRTNARRCCSGSPSGAAAPGERGRRRDAGPSARPRDAAAGPGAAGRDHGDLGAELVGGEARGRRAPGAHLQRAAPGLRRHRHDGDLPPRPAAARHPAPRARAAARPGAVQRHLVACLRRLRGQLPRLRPRRHPGLHHAAVGSPARRSGAGRAAPLEHPGRACHRARRRRRAGRPRLAGPSPGRPGRSTTSGSAGACRRRCSPPGRS